MNEPTPSLDDRILGLDCSDLTFEQVSRIIAWYKNSRDQILAAHEQAIRSESDRAVEEFVEGLEAEYGQMRQYVAFSDINEFLVEWRNK